MWALAVDGEGWSGGLVVGDTKRVGSVVGCRDAAVRWRVGCCAGWGGSSTFVSVCVRPGEWVVVGPSSAGSGVVVGVQGTLMGDGLVRPPL